MKVVHDRSWNAVEGKNANDRVWHMVDSNYQISSSICSVHGPVDAGQDTKNVGF